MCVCVCVSVCVCIYPLANVILYMHIIAIRRIVMFTRIEIHRFALIDHQFQMRTTGPRYHLIQALNTEGKEIF